MIAILIGGPDDGKELNEDWINLDLLLIFTPVVEPITLELREYPVAKIRKNTYKLLIDDSGFASIDDYGRIRYKYGG